ncbi:3-oxoacid CoA-transferase subunit A [uncultured Salinisphaera sp.]|uniref:3-oxoacid CoA-transferase subunit A n=1 Tax=uncultured Salinisphaera sp. TaxID=359372 RepID=UPI0032B20928|tara:strand:- start:722 stop:1390 length:669 start_codon:yes stop_codon:yes gene_type:complete
MIDKFVTDMASAVADMPDGAHVMIGGFGSSGIPFALIDAVCAAGPRHLTVISNNTGSGETGVSALLREGLVDKVICSYPRSRGSVWFERLYTQRAIELELVPQGTLAERMRAAGAGLGGFFTPTGYGTALAKGKETRMIDGRGHVLEAPLAADYALLSAARADPWGNLVYNTAARNFNPVMATAARCTVVEVAQAAALGALDPEAVATPGIFVDRVAVREAL